jgi:hypothetical protein
MPIWGTVSLPTRHSLLAFDSWFYSGWRDISAEPRTAEDSSAEHVLQVSAVVCNPGGPLVDPTALVSECSWQESSCCVCYTASMKRDRLRALTCFRLSAQICTSGNNELGQAPAAPG